MIRIEIRDYSDYEEAHSHNGGAYAWGDTITIDGDTIYIEPWTSAEFCPYCHRFDCSGECSSPERITAERAAAIVRQAIEYGHEVTIE